MATTRGIRKTGMSVPSKRTHNKSTSVTDPLGLEKDLMAMARSIPDSEWEKLPKDLNENLDHYLYGLPKRASPKHVKT